VQLLPLFLGSCSIILGLILVAHNGRRREQEF
jgi:hypothetical protein